MSSRLSAGDVCSALKTRKQAADFKRQNGIKQTTKPNYNGYTGYKNHDFPVTPYLDKLHYPDVTENFLQLREKVFKVLDKLSGGPKEINKANTVKCLSNPGVLKFLVRNLQTGESLDTKFNPDFPGRDKKCRTQYALYKKKIVSANYLSNNFYGQITARLGLFFRVSKLIGSTAYGAGFFELSYGRLPTWDVLQFKDPQEDIDSIRSGYYDYLDNDPWKNADSYGLDPRRPYPKKNYQMVILND
jgi:hypothetical protein